MAGSAHTAIYPVHTEYIHMVQFVSKVCAGTAIEPHADTLYKDVLWQAEEGR